MSAYGRTYRLFTNAAVGSETQAASGVPVGPSNDNLDSLAHVWHASGTAYDLIIQGRLIDGSQWADLVAFTEADDSSEDGAIKSFRSCPQMRVKVGSTSNVAIGALHVDIIS